MSSVRAGLYRSLLKELKQSSIAGKLPKPLCMHFRTLVEQAPEITDAFRADVDNALLSLRSQREYKRLLDRYNPLFDLTAEERIEATARRVGLNMPKKVNIE